MQLQDNLDEERQMVNDNATKEVQTGNRQSMTNGIRQLDKSGMLVKCVGMPAGTIGTLAYWGCPPAGPPGGRRLVGILWNIS
jgi:hypothetical protein